MFGVFFFWDLGLGGMDVVNLSTLVMLWTLCGS